MAILDTVLLLALPASGKSEVRKYLKHLDAETARRDFHMGGSAQLDDFPYVHVMRRIDDELAALGKPRLFFHALTRPFQDGRDWLTLIHLLNEDHVDLVAKYVVEAPSAGKHLVARIDVASEKAGIEGRFAKVGKEALGKVAAALESEARAMLEEKHAGYVDLAGRTLVIEFARGGPDGATQPLADPLGYRASISRLAPEILERAAILYIWVTPEESRRKNIARGDPNDPGSILHHSVPLEVMMNDYGCDDMDWLEAHSDRPGTIAIEAHGRTFHLPIARFDNRVDKTSFIRNDKASWKPDEVKAVHEGLRGALEKLAQSRATRLSGAH
jgi:hypothetical protein